MVLEPGLPMFRILIANISGSRERSLKWIKFLETLVLLSATRWQWLVKAVLAQCEASPDASSDSGVSRSLPGILWSRWPVDCVGLSGLN